MVNRIMSKIAIPESMYIATVTDNCLTGNVSPQLPVVNWITNKTGYKVNHIHTCGYLSLLMSFTSTVKTLQLIDVFLILFFKFYSEKFDSWYNNGPYSLFVCASYFISCSVHAWLASITFIDCKWRWGYRHFWTSRISIFCIEAIELIIR